TYYLENVGGGGLLLQGLTQLVKQPGGLDRDDRLLGEVLNQLNLAVGKRANFLPINNQSADQLTFPKDWNAEKGPHAPELYSCPGVIRFADAHPLLGHVLVMNYLLGCSEQPKSPSRIR